MDMSLSTEEKKEMGEAPSLLSDKPKYPYGLRINLNDAEIKKLGIQNVPSVGDKMSAGIQVEVISVSADNNEGDKKEFSISLQITDMELEKKKEKSENDTSVFYGA